MRILFRSQSMRRARGGFREFTLVPSPRWARNRRQTAIYKSSTRSHSRRCVLSADPSSCYGKEHKLGSRASRCPPEYVSWTARARSFEQPAWRSNSVTSRPARVQRVSRSNDRDGSRSSSSHRSRARVTLRRPPGRAARRDEFAESVWKKRRSEPTLSWATERAGRRRLTSRIVRDRDFYAAERPDPARRHLAQYNRYNHMMR